MFCILNSASVLTVRTVAQSAVTVAVRPNFRGAESQK